MSFQDELRAAAESAKDEKTARRQGIEAAKAKITDFVAPAIHDAEVVFGELGISSSSGEGLELLIDKARHFAPGRLYFRFNPAKRLVICESSEEGVCESCNLELFTADKAQEKVREFFQEIVSRWYFSR